MHDLVLGMRVNGQEWGHEKGITSEESQEFVRILEAVGLDYIIVTGWVMGKVLVVGGGPEGMEAARVTADG